MQANPRTLPCIIVAKENGLDVELVPTTPFDEEFKKINPIGRIPAFVGANGFTLTETIAISIFRKCPEHLFSVPCSKDESYYQYSYPWQKNAC